MSHTIAEETVQAEKKGNPDARGVITFSYHAFVILFPEEPRDFPIDRCDLQGKLRDDGVFQHLHTALLLPESYIILGVFFDVFSGNWNILVGNEYIPAPSREGERLMRVIPVYEQLGEKRRLKEIRFEP